MGDRLKCGSSESRGTCAVAPISDRQAVNLGRRLSFLELRVSITHELCRSPHIFEHHNECDEYEVDRFGESIHDHPNRIKLVGHQ
jgi:hypothetical protein